MTTRRVGTELRRRAIALLDQQLWCWGCDIARPEGNVLLGLGMCRYRSRENGHDRTAYTARVFGDGVVWLWGFGLLYCIPNHGGVFLRRNGFEPLLIDQPLERPVHSPDQLPNPISPATVHQRSKAQLLVRAAAGWVASYEHWIVETFGSAYREATLTARDKAPAVPSHDMAEAWEHLSKKAVRLTVSATRAIGPWGKLLTALQPVFTSPSDSAQRRWWASRSQQQRYRTV